MSQSTPARARTLAEELVETFTTEIRQGRLRPGDKLPTEAALVGRFGVSRTVVREAISRLAASGLAETHHGIGTFVTEAQSVRSSRIDAGEITTMMDVIAVLELRAAIESEAAAIAARRRTAAQLKGMREALDEFEAHVEDAGDTVTPDFRFHRLIAEATGNRYFVELMTSLGTRIIPRTRVDSAKLAREKKGPYLHRVNREHEDIYDAIARGDPDGARAAMRTHLSNSRERLQKARPGPGHDATS